MQRKFRKIKIAENVSKSEHMSPNFYSNRSKIKIRANPAGSKQMAT